MSSLVDQFCPNVHDAPITAAAYDPSSGTVATADADGIVAVQRPGERTPRLLFQPGGAVDGALDLIAGGSLIAVGDILGNIGVYRTDDGAPIFTEYRDGAQGRVRAFRGVAINAQASMLASISRDHLVRIWDLNRKERVVAWSNFSGDTVEFDRRGERLLAMDDAGQPRLMDLLRVESLHMDQLQTPAERAMFTRDGLHIVAAGPAGLTLLRVADGAMVRGFVTQGGSGIVSMHISPDGLQVGVVTRRQVHRFSLPNLQPIASQQHGASEPSGAAYWLPSGVFVAGNDGRMHNGEVAQAVTPVLRATGFGDHRVAIHSDRLSIWKNNQRSNVIHHPNAAAIRAACIDRDGHLLVTTSRREPIQIINCNTGRLIFDGGPITTNARRVSVGGAVVAVHLREGGIRWWDLNQNRGFALGWPQAMALSNGGTWLGVVTPRGYVSIIDPRTGEDAMQPPEPLADCAIKQLAFVNRSPDLLVLDEEGVLGHYDLENAARGGHAAVGRDVITLNVPVDRIWGLTGGQHCAMRLTEDSQCSIISVHIPTGKVVHEVSGLPSHAWVDAGRGTILTPTRSGAILEQSMDGAEQRVLRSLPDEQWLSYGHNGIIAASDQVAQSL